MQKSPGGSSGAFSPARHFLAESLFTSYSYCEIVGDGELSTAKPPHPIRCKRGRSGGKLVFFELVCEGFSAAQGAAIGGESRTSGSEYPRPSVGQRGAAQGRQAAQAAFALRGGAARGTTQSGGPGVEERRQLVGTRRAWGPPTGSPTVIRSAPPGAGLAH